MKTRYIIGSIIIFVALSASAYLLTESQIQYSTISKARATGKKVQIKGRWVERERSFYDPTANIFHFVLEDEEGTRTLVQYHGSKPNNFELAEAIVIRGKMSSTSFAATEILTKCPTKYEGASPLPPHSLQPQ